MPKQRSGPSDEQAKNPGAGPGRGKDKPTAGGVDANASKKDLYEQARDLGVSGRSKMDKGELVDALRKESDRRTARARSS